MSIGSQQEILDFLMSPETHGCATVERIDTHISIVFLAGSRALKLKRAVRYLAETDDFGGLPLLPLFLSCRAAIRAKTSATSARVLAPSVGRVPGAVVLRSDEIRKRLCGVFDIARLGPDRYTADVNSHAYQTINTHALAALGSGHSVIVDAVFAQPGPRPHRYSQRCRHS